MPLVRAAARGEIRGGDFSDTITGCLQPPRGKNIRSEKYCIGNIFHSFLLIFLCFSMTSIAWLAWVYHLMGIIHDPVRIDLITLVAGYLSQAGGLCLFICLDRSVSRSRRQDFLHIYGYSVFSASTAVFFLCCIPAVLSRFPAGTFVFGCLMNVAIGMIAGFYLHDLAARVDKKRRGTVFGSSYGLSSIAVWLLSLAGNPNIMHSPYVLVLLLVLCAAAMMAFRSCCTADDGSRLSHLISKTIPDADSDGGHAGESFSAPREQIEPIHIHEGGPGRSLLLLAALTVFLFSLEKNLGFNFPSADIASGVNLELSRTVYATGLIAAGLISDRSRKSGAVCAFAALITPFIMLSLSGETISSTIFWGLDYFFYGFFSVYRILLFSDLAAGNLSGHAAAHADGPEGSADLPQNTDTYAGLSLSADRPARSTDTTVLTGTPTAPCPLYLAALGLLYGRLGDAVGTLYSTGLRNRTALLVIITTLFFALSVFVFFRLYQLLYMPVLVQRLRGTHKSPQQQFEDFSGRYQLTVRERSVLRLVLEEKTNAEIANELYISESTVKFHIHNLLKKTGCSNRINLYAKYRHAGLL